MSAEVIYLKNANGEYATYKEVKTALETGMVAVCKNDGAVNEYYFPVMVTDVPAVEGIALHISNNNGTIKHISTMPIS